MHLCAGSLLGHHRPKGEEGASSCSNPSMSRAAKGTAASTSSQPQAVMDSSADTSAPLASRLAGGENLEKSSSIGHTLSNEAVLTRATPDRNQSAPGAGAPTGDFWERSGQHEPRRVPGHGAPSSKSSSQRRRPVNEAVPTRITPDRNQSAPGADAPTGDFWKRSGQHEPRRVPGHGAPSSKSSSKRRRPVNEAVPTRITPDMNQSAPGAGTPTGDFWKRSGQHEPRMVPGHGAPSIEVVFRQALPVLFSQWTCPTSTRTPPPAAAAPAHPGSFVPPTVRNRAMAHP